MEHAHATSVSITNKMDLKSIRDVTTCTYNYKHV